MTELASRGGRGARALHVALALGAAFAVMRAIGTLGPARLAWTLPLSFVLMTLMPFVLLTREGRQQIGLRRPARASDTVTAIAVGSLCAGLCFVIGVTLFGSSGDNWFVTTANRYRAAMDTSNMSVLQLHLVFTSVACTFSPIGEELYFRGLLQRTLEDRYTRQISTGIEAGMFGVVHLCHHGVTMTTAGLQFQHRSALIWVALMIGTGALLAALRHRSESLVPAIAAHAAFNATMNVAIFGALWP